MSSLGETLAAKEQLLTTARTNNKTIVTNVNNCKGYQCTPEQVDWLVEQAEAHGFVTAGWRKWHCQAAYKLGSELYQRCISMAKDNKNPTPKLFSYLLNLELKKHKAPPEAGKVTNT